MSTGTLPATTSPVAQRWFVAVLVCFFVGLSVHYSFKAIHHRSAVLRWQAQIASMGDGEDIYQRYNYPNPPIMAILLTPLAKMPPLAFALIWFYLKVGMVLLTFGMVFRLAETPATPFPPWAKAVAVLLSLRPIMGDLEHGNINLFIVFLVVGALYAFHQRRDLLCGVLLALAIACKVTPALFVAYLVWKRAWKSLAGVVLGLGLFFWVVPACFLGWEQNNQLLGSWVDQMVKPFVVGGVVTSEHNNQSLPGLVFRLLTESPSFSTYDANDQYVPTEYHNILSLSVRQAGWLIKGCMALFAGLVMLTCRTRTEPRAGWRLAAEYSIVVLGMLLFSERTWKHHCVTLVLPFGVICYCLATCPLSRRFRWALVAALAVVTLLMATTSTSLLDERAAKLAQVYGAYVWSCVILVACLVGLLRSACYNDGQ